MQTWKLRCPNCSHLSSGPIGLNVSCPCCDKTMYRPLWASADASDTCRFYVWVGGLVSPNPAGKANGYA